MLECAAIEVCDKRAGEAVKLIVVRKDTALSEDALAQYCRTNFTAYKRPKISEFRGDLPRIAVGKILRLEPRSAI